MERVLHVNTKRVLETSAILLLVTLLAEGQIPTLTISPSPVEIGSNFTAVCNVEINDAISFLVGINVIGSCRPPFLGSGCTPSKIEQDTTTQTTTWTQIADLNHEGSWKCRRLADDSLPATLNMYKCPASTRSENGISSNLELNDTLTSAVNVTFETECIYPPNNTEIVLQFKSGSQELDANITCAASATTCTVGTAYECNHQISYGMSLMNDGKFEFSRNYTIHFKVSTRIKDCEGVAIFDRYSLLFIEPGASVLLPTSTNETTTHVSKDCKFGENIPDSYCILYYILVPVCVIGGVAFIFYLVYRICNKDKQDSKYKSSENVTPFSTSNKTENINVYYSTNRDTNTTDNTNEIKL